MNSFLKNSFLVHSLGLVLLNAFLSALVPDNQLNTPVVQNSMLVVSLCYLIIVNIIPQVTKYLLVPRKFYIAPISFTVFAAAFLFILFSRIDYSRSLLLFGFSYTFCWLMLLTHLRKGIHTLKLSAIPNFNVEELAKYKRLRLSTLEPPYDVATVDNSGIVINLHKNITSEQEKFIADCSISGIPVFHEENVYEMLRGKVKIEHLKENTSGTLQPDPIYLPCKRIWESLLILLSIPIVLPIMLITAILIKLESKGSIIYTQYRIGQAGKPFKIYKFRSMTNAPKDQAATYATQDQHRITRVGKFIRKMRIDELPQFFNVLKGEMALIGPRPELESIVIEYEETIPFFNYRHIVKPGITGWAQTVQGYTDDHDSYTDKLAHDLYYIKHLSFWLDLNIIYKTIWTIVTGFGAK